MAAFLGRASWPLAVRSSSLLEDDMAHPFAGIYATIMISNSGEDLEARFVDLCRAVKVVYASVFFEEARTYLENTDHSVEEERMAVVVQRLVGRRQHAEELATENARLFAQQRTVAQT